MIEEIKELKEQMEIWLNLWKTEGSVQGLYPTVFPKKRLELRKNEKRARSPFFKTNSQDSYRRDGIFEKAWLRQTEIGGVKVIVGWWFVWYLVDVL